MSNAARGARRGAPRSYAPPTQTRLNPVSVGAEVASSRQKPQRVGCGKQSQVARFSDGEHVAGSVLHVYVLGSAGTSVWMVSQYSWRASQDFAGPQGIATGVVGAADAAGVARRGSPQATSTSTKGRSRVLMRPDAGDG